MISGAIFDIDGVLLDSMGIWRDLGSRYLKKNNIVPNPDTDKVIHSMSMEQGAEYLKENYALHKETEKIFNEIKSMLRDFYFFEVCAKKGAADMLELLKEQNIAAVCATSSPREHVSRALERTGLLKYISKIYTTSEVGESKHSPKIYLEAAKFLNTEPCETLVFEDSLYALKTAAAAGFRAVGVFDMFGADDKKDIEDCGTAFVEDLSDTKRVRKLIEQNK